MGLSAYLRNDKLEFFPTQEWVKEALYSMMSGKEKTVLDPCCGDGGLEYFDKGYNYKLFDIEDRNLKNVEICDFLQREPKNNERYDCAVINPPFGLIDEFIAQAFKYTNDIYLIAPLKKTIKKWDFYIKDIIYDWRIPYQCFKILTSVGLFHLSKNNKFTFGAIKSSVSDLYKKELPIEKTWENCFFRTDKAPNKYFVVNRLTKARVQRGEELIKKSDIYEPNDESAFVAICGNLNVKTGDILSREICTFGTKEDAYTFRQKYIDNADYVRNYCYIYGGMILHSRKIPLL